MHARALPAAALAASSCRTTSVYERERAKRVVGLLAFVISTGLGMRVVRAQDAQPAPGASQVPPSAPNLPPTGTDAAAPTNPPPPAVPAPPPPRPAAPAPEIARAKPLRTSAGAAPTSVDTGSETAITNQNRAANTDEAIALRLKKWDFSMKTYLRAPMRIGVGPRNDGRPGSELHTPPRIVGLGSGDWNYLALAPNPSVSVYLNATNGLVSANVILGSNTLYEGGFKDLDQYTGISQAFLTLKFPSAFGSRGGLSWTVGAFSNRYGMAGRNGTNSGYYSTYLFGRTHVMGEVLAADVDLSDDLELVIEHGIGTQVEPLPWFQSTRLPPKTSVFAGQGDQPNGSNFVHHAHAQLIVGRRVALSAHYLTSWTPNDNNFADPNLKEARLTVFGGDVRYDGDSINTYLGYSRVDASNLLPLSDGVQVIHGGNGKGFKEDYFGPKQRSDNTTWSNDTGTVDTLLGQYTMGLSSVTELPLGLREISVAAYGMFNHVRSPKTALAQSHDVNHNQLKFGGEIEFGLPKAVGIGLRFDRVIPHMLGEDDAYSALSPRIKLYIKGNSLIILNYTHYYLGPTTYPDSPYSDISYKKPDPDMLVLSANLSF